MLNWIAWNRIVFDIEIVLMSTVFDIETVLTLNWTFWIRTVWLNWLAWNRNAGQPDGEVPVALEL